MAGLPSSIGGYRVLGELGRGGMGAVYRGVDPEGRAVAIKVLVAGRDAPPAQRLRFGREARALGKVDHPGVVRLLDVGEQGGVPYLVMDFHPGGTLQSELDGERLFSPARAAQVGVDLAAALEAAHTLGVLHRDVKPENVLLSATGRALLTDFGLVKDLDRQGETQRLTQSGTFLGTPGYWAPEQTLGQPDAIGAAADVYGIGATLYAALTGRPPIVGASLVEVLQATLDARPPPLRSLRPGIPSDLEAIVARCLEKNPAQRWGSAAELGASLRAFLEGERLPSPARGARWGASFVALVLLAALGALGVVAATRRTPPESSSVELPLPGREGSPSPELPGPHAPSPATPGPTMPTADTPNPSPTGEPTLTPERARVLCDRVKELFRARRDPEALALLPRVAKAGNLEAILMLGMVLEHGRGVEKDLAQAARWYRVGADKGSALAMFNLGTLYEEGKGVEKDSARAGHWFRLSAEAGVVIAMNKWGVWQEHGRGVPQDLGGATRSYRAAAEGGDLNGMFNLAKMLRLGKGVSADYVQAERWYRRAALKGHVLSMVYLGKMLAAGQGIPKDPRQAGEWLGHAAKAGNAEAILGLGLLWEAGAGRRQDLALAAQSYEGAAKKGNVQGMYRLGFAFSTGRGVPQDHAAAYRWYRRAAQGGVPAAMFNLANALRMGKGVVRDEAQALTWYRRAAEAGDAKAPYNLGIMYFGGLGTEPDPVQGKVWLERGVSAGDPSAMLGLARLLSAGKHEPQDVPRAVGLYRRVLAEGDAITKPIARKALKRLGVPE